MVNKQWKPKLETPQNEITYIILQIWILFIAFVVSVPKSLAENLNSYCQIRNYGFTTDNSHKIIYRKMKIWW